MSKTYRINSLACAVASIVIASSSLSSQAQLIVDLPFDGDAQDRSGFGHHGTVSGATLTEDRFGNANSAYHFDGNDFIMLSGRITPEFFTLSAWMRTTSNSSKSMVVIRNRWYAWNMGLDGFYDSERAYFGNNITPANVLVSGSSSPDLALNDGEWHHLATTFDGDMLRGYVNGEVVYESDPLPAGSTTRYINLSAVGIGRDGDNNDFHFTGDIDDVQIYNRGLTSEEVLALANVPEPSSLAALALGGLIATRRRSI